MIFLSECDFVDLNMNHFNPLINTGMLMYGKSMSFYKAWYCEG